LEAKANFLWAHYLLFLLYVGRNTWLSMNGNGGEHWVRWRDLSVCWP